MSKISMYVMAHKKYYAPKIDIFKPMQVGAALHDDLGYIRDDTGDNISVKNPNYSELTGVYWVWKNDHDSDIVGICHYRRFFADDNLELVNGDYIEKALENAEVVTTHPAKTKDSLYAEYCLAHNEADLIETRKAIQKLYPDYLETFDEVMNGRLLYFANMMIARKSVFDAYCKWLFDILFEVERNLDISEYTDYNKRVFGFISERLLAVWLQKNQIRIFHVYVIVSSDKAETTELAEWGVDRLNAGEYDKLISKFDERRTQYLNLFQEDSDTFGHLNFLYELAKCATENGDRSALLKLVSGKYFAQNYYLEYMRCMFDVLRGLKSKAVMLGAEHAVYGCDLATLSDVAPLSMLTQDLGYDVKMFDHALASADDGQLQCCILVAQDSILYERTKDAPAGAGVMELVYDVLFDIDADKIKHKPWEFAPEGLLSDEEKNMIESACRGMALKKGGFFNDTNPRGRNLSMKAVEDIDIEKTDSRARNCFEYNKRQLEELAQKCAKDGIRLVLVVPPVRQDDEKRKALRAELLNILEELPYPVEYQDLNSEIWDGIFFDEDFYNDELLNESGARKFSQIVNELSQT